jgi:hypothetical protein
VSAIGGFARECVVTAFSRTVVRRAALLLAEQDAIIDGETEEVRDAYLAGVTDTVAILLDLEVITGLQRDMLLAHIRSVPV